MLRRSCLVIQVNELRFYRLHAVITWRHFTKIRRLSNHQYDDL